MILYFLLNVSKMTLHLFKRYFKPVFALVKKAICPDFAK